MSYAGSREEPKFTPEFIGLYYTLRGLRVVEYGLLIICVLSGLFAIAAFSARRAGVYEAFVEPIVEKAGGPLTFEYLAIFMLFYVVLLLLVYYIRFDRLYEFQINEFNGMKEDFHGIKFEGGDLPVHITETMESFWYSQALSSVRTGGGFS